MTKFVEWPVVFRGLVYWAFVVCLRDKDSLGLARFHVHDIKRTKEDFRVLFRQDVSFRIPSCSIQEKSVDIATVSGFLGEVFPSVTLHFEIPA